MSMWITPEPSSRREMEDITTEVMETSDKEVQKLLSGIFEEPPAPPPSPLETEPPRQEFRRRCPIHVNQCMDCKEYEWGRFWKCIDEDCPVAFGEENAPDVLQELNGQLHLLTKEAILAHTFKCDCEYTPHMGFSRSSKNFRRVFFKCPSKAYPCQWFSWAHHKPRKNRHLPPFQPYAESAPRRSPTKRVVYALERSRSPPRIATQFARDPRDYSDPRVHRVVVHPSARNARPSDVRRIEMVPDHPTECRKKTVMYTANF